MKKNILIIGAGPGGLTAGMILSYRGFNVTIIEKEGEVGGRNAAIKLGGYTFDTGPTFLMMNFILDEMFALAGKDVKDYLEVIKIDPMYRLKFDDVTVFPTNDRNKMKRHISELFPGNEKGYDRFFKKEKIRFEKMYPCLQIDYSHIWKFLTMRLLKALPYLSFGKSLFGNLGSYFNKEKLKLSFTFQAKYLGMSPWECPAAFTMIPYIEHNYGIYHVKGGLNNISHAMKKVFLENGGILRLNTKAKTIVTKKGRTIGVETETGEIINADAVIINADFAYAMSTLAKNAGLKKYSEKNLKKKRYSCSTFMLYLALDKKYDIPHHNIFFANDYTGNIDDIFKNNRLSKDTSIYIQNACKTDPSLAPEGCSTIYVLVPVANTNSGIDWEKEKVPFREIVLKTIEEKTELKDIRQHIKYEKIITPEQWKNDYNVFFGATFNLAHNILQMMYFRPHNKFEELENCYIAGGGTHPGSGLPTIYESGRITANMISKKYGIKYKNVDFKNKYD